MRPRRDGLRREVRFGRRSRERRRISIPPRKESGKRSSSAGQFLWLGWAVLKKRITPVQLLLDGRLVKTKQFGAYRDVGDPVASSRVYNAQNADELVFLNINRSARGIDPLLTLLERVSAVTFMPLSLGGGVTSYDSAARLIRSGADKVVLNSAAYNDPQLITKIADAFGTQAVIVSIDARLESGSGEYTVYSDCGRKAESVTLD